MKAIRFSIREVRAVLLLGFALSISEPCVGAPGVFQQTGSLATARSVHKAALLGSGKVLVVGGFDTTAIASAEIYDPASGTWSGTGSLTIGRYEHTITRLQSGEVMVSGGLDANGNVLTSAELWDPTTNTWSATGSLITARQQHRAMLLASGKVLVMGGLDGNGNATATAELFDPAAGTWARTGDLITGRFQHTAGLLSNGTILVVGGIGASGGLLNSAEVFDPATQKWSPVGPLADARTLHTQTLLQSGKVLVAGGVDLKGASISGELYDPATNTWSGTGALNDARSRHTANLLSDGTVLVTGGDGFTSPLNSAEIYNPSVNEWSLTGNLFTARDSQTATPLNNGQILVVGGNNSGALTSTELYLQSGLPVITSPLVASATVGVPFSYQFEATAADLLDVDGNSLPSGLSYNSDLRAIVGTSELSGTFSVNLTATNVVGTTTATLTLTVQPFPTGPVIMSVSSATGRTGSPFRFQVFTKGGSPATRLATKGLPVGLSADQQTGEITGTVATDGSYLVTLFATDAGITNTATLELTFTSDPARPVITSAVSAPVFPGIPFLYQIDAMVPDTFDPIHYDEIGQLPPVLGLNTATGLISGTPLSPISSGPAPDLAGGVVTNVQLFACNPNGCSAQGLFFLSPTGAVNISTRLSVGTGDNVLIAGFITQGNAPAKLLARGIGPTLAVSDRLANPYLELHSGSSTIASNDNWKVNLAGGSQEVAIENTTIPPTNDLESAILAVLDHGAYTAILRGVNNGIGVGLVEVFNLGAASLDQDSTAYLANISTRGFVQTGDNVMIGGFINLATQPIKVVVRAIGPSLAAQGVTNVLADPTLVLTMPDGSTITNDNWMSNSSQVADITTIGLNPSNPAESVILLTLPVLGDTTHGYTAIVRGANNTTGVGLVEAYFGNPCLVNGKTGKMVCP